LKDLSFATVVLAAGRSVRMGRPKLLLPWGTTTVLGQIIQQWQELRARQIGVVCAAGDTPIVDEVKRLTLPGTDCIDNQNAASGMFGSIRSAASWPGWQPGLTHWAIVLGDQPHLKLTILRQLLDLAAENRDAVCQPQYQGRLVHPVLMPSHIFHKLPQTRHETLKDFLQAQRVFGFACDDCGLALDIDWPEDYLQALNLAGL
jgi:molybdenum cofactor cytidylyltransferase